MEELKKRFHEEYPDRFFMSDSVAEMNEFLKKRHWLKENEAVQSMEKPGEGNMNLVRRVRTGERSFIMKQARPWVEKYPSIDAPVERSAIEAKFFRLAGQDPVLKAFSPELLHVDVLNFILMVEDLGGGSDYTFLYQPGEYLTEDEITSLTGYLNALHALRPDTFPDNRAMRDLNHEHIFHFPYLEDNGLNLDHIQDGLMAASLQVKKNELLKKKIHELGKLYFETGPVLIQGDYFPGSWLRTPSGLKVIDPEFSFLGYPEFELGVFLAHMVMAQQKKEHIRQVIREYECPVSFNDAYLAGFTGIEVLRRLIGVGQLPLSLSIEQKKEMIALATQWILSQELDLSGYAP